LKTQLKRPFLKFRKRLKRSPVTVNKRKWLLRPRLLKISLKLRREVSPPLTLSDKWVRHATRVPLETAVEVVAVIGPAQLEEDVAVVENMEKETPKIGQQLKAVAAVEATEAEVTVSAEDVVAETALAMIALLMISLNKEIKRPLNITAEA